MIVTTEVWLAVGYTAFLLTAANGLRSLARRTGRGPHSRSIARGETVENVAEAPWPHSDAARFERGLAVVLEVLAVFILTVTTVRNPEAALVSSGAFLLLVLASHGQWLGRRLKSLRGRH